ncbi:hypothetical protein SAMN05216389_11842 [Oceanobacillus limi]|uniref:Uncharacterized protein n=1 Tax=Oceanobacillus limi TaxID=930131 RepID=A0A1I0G152_9BACI|nr:hypothetical protein [Oceanobacillus limi]SET64309.1 hypothetical protein SAMN05216389_11842 [Oceanobacillus limi]
MELFTTIIVVVIISGMIFLMARGFLAESFCPGKVVRYILLFIIGAFVGGSLLYIYSDLGIESDALRKFGNAASILFVIWLELKKEDENSERETSKASDMKLLRVLPISFVVISIVPLFVTFN